MYLELTVVTYIYSHQVFKFNDKTKQNKRKKKKNHAENRETSAQQVYTLFVAFGPLFLNHRLSQKEVYKILVDDRRCT